MPVSPPAPKASLRSKAEPPAPAPIRALAHRDIAATVEVLARAFRDTPLTCAVIEGSPERRLRCNRRGMEVLLRSADGRASLLGRDQPGGPKALSAALVAAPPGVFPLPSPGPLRLLRYLLGQGPRVVRRWGEVSRALEAVHPEGPHWYLSLLGVEPSLQARGLGSELLRHWLSQVDREPAVIYLETDVESNCVFYEREGFAVENEIQLLGVPLWCMARPARNPENP
ncbi:MAG: GNAT family N-acetyltransferase [Myxococcota bacterium]